MGYYWQKISNNKKLASGTLAAVLILIGAVVIMQHSERTKNANWQEVKSIYSPIAAVFNQVVVGAKAAMEIDPGTGEVGFGLLDGQERRPQIFTKMKGGSFGSPLSEGNKIKWFDVLPAVDVELHIFDGHLKEFIYIKEPSAAHSFEFDLTKDFVASEGIELRDNGGMTITTVDKKTGKELLTFDYPIATDARGKKIPYHYRLVGEKTLVMEAHDPRLLQDIKYPLVLDPPMTVREYDEILVKIGQNGDEPGNAKDGDIVTVKPMGWPWGKMEYRDYVIVRVPKMTQKEREIFDKRFQSIGSQERVQVMENHQPPPQSQTEHLDGAYMRGLDYAALIKDERVKIIKKNKDGLEEETTKNELMKIIRDRSKDNPIIDATELNLNEIIKQKEFALMYDKIKKGELKLALAELPADESVLAKDTRLAKRLEEKKSWLARVWDKLVKPARAATNTYSIGTSSRDYSTIQAWEDARDGGTDIEKGECYNDSTFTAGVTIDGTTGDADSYMWLTVASGNRHSGTAGTGVKVDMSSTGAVITTGDDYTIVEWLEITGFGSSYAHDVGFWVDSASNTIRNNIIHDEVADNRGQGVYLRASGSVVYNNIIYGGDIASSFNLGGIYFTYSWGSVYNNTIYEITGPGIAVEGGYTISVKNNIVSSAANCYIAYSGGSFGTDSDSDYNIASDTTAPGSHSVQNATSYADYYSVITNDAEDLHLKSGSIAINAGADLSAIFTTDIDGQTRPTGASTWDIGADEVASSFVVSAISDTPDPTNPNRSVSFIVDWAGEGPVKVKICKTDSLTAQNCDGGFWASSTDFTLNDPVVVTYDVVAEDAGQTRDYAVFVCDSTGDCTTGTTGSFSVNTISTVPNIKVRGGLRVR